MFPTEGAPFLLHYEQNMHFTINKNRPLTPSLPVFVYKVACYCSQMFSPSFLICMWALPCTVAQRIVRICSVCADYTAQYSSRTRYTAWVRNLNRGGDYVNQLRKQLVETGYNIRRADPFFYEEVIPVYAELLHLARVFLPELFQDVDIMLISAQLFCNVLHKRLQHSCIIFY